MQTTHIRVPVDIKEKLEERANGRPLYQMLQEDFLHEPDTITLLKIKLDHFQKQVESLKVINNTLVDVNLQLISKIGDVEAYLQLIVVECLNPRKGGAR